MVRYLTQLCLVLMLAGCAEHRKTNAMNETKPAGKSAERQVTSGPGGRILTNIRVWSPDGQWIAYDVRSDAAGDQFDGDRIEMVNVASGEVKLVYRARAQARCGVVTFHPVENKAVFILGPEDPTPDWQYNAYHRQGLIVDLAKPSRAPENLDARDLVAPLTPGALRGGSHVHVWDGAGECVSFTYEDHLLAVFSEESPEHEMNLRNVGVSMPGRPVHAGKEHARNHNGSHFSVLVTRTVAYPRPGSDEIKRAFEEGWVGTNGYVRRDGSRQRRALAFQGHVIIAGGETLSEVFIVDLPEDLTAPGDGPLEGTAVRRPLPPRGTVQRRLTYTADRKFAGLQGPRHWLRCSPDGSRIAFLMKDDAGIVQLWTISPNGGAPVQVTRNRWPVASTFTWSPDGRFMAHVMDRSVCVTDTGNGATHRLTLPSDESTAPRPEACVFSPDGRQIAFVRRLAGTGGIANQICVVSVGH